MSDDRTEPTDEEIEAAIKRARERVISEEPNSRITREMEPVRSAIDELVSDGPPPMIPPEYAEEVSRLVHEPSELFRWCSAMDSEAEDEPFPYEQFFERRPNLLRSTALRYIKFRDGEDGDVEALPDNVEEIRPGATTFKPERVGRGEQYTSEDLERMAYENDD